MNLSIQFLFVKIIEKVIRLRTVMILRSSLKIWVKSGNIRGNNFQKGVIQILLNKCAYSLIKFRVGSQKSRRGAEKIFVAFFILL